MAAPAFYYYFSVTNMAPAKVKIWFHLLHIFLVFTGLQCSTHWMVTEDGRVQQQVDTVFVMKRPYDLVALMQQEKRSELVESFKKELLVHKQRIDENEDKETNLEEKFYKTNPHCVLVDGKPLGEFSLYSGTYVAMKDRNLDEYEWFVSDEDLTQYDEPVCTAFTALDFSMLAYDHLSSIKARENLTMPKDESLLLSIVDLDVPSFGHLIHHRLKQNKTSWVLYNVAAYFWRIQGEPVNAVECVRRALHYVPKEYRDICLLNLANILHMSHHSEEAAIILHNAIDLQPNVAMYHYTLGSIYAVLADYNSSLICFENALKLRPEFTESTLLKNAVLCHSQLEKALESQHDSLQRTLGELKELQKRQEQLFYQQEKLRAEQASFSAKLEQRLQYEEQKLREALESRGATCYHYKKDGQAVVSCKVDNANSKIKSAEIHFLYEDELLPVQPSANVKISYADTVADSDSLLTVSLTEALKKHAVEKSPTEESREKVEISATFRYPRRLSKEEQVERTHYQDPKWPSPEECNKTVKSFPKADRFPTSYISPDNKGFNVSHVLTVLQDLDPKISAQHSLPWFPPICDEDEGSADPAPNNLSVWIDSLAPIKDDAKLRTLKIPDPDIRHFLTSHIDSSTEVAEEEIGQRILTAIHRSLAPRWVLYTLATLYWRIQGDITNALMCVRASLSMAPYNLSDVPLVNLAGILFKMKEYSDSAEVARKALSINSAEPMSNFFLANVYSVTGNFTGAVHHYKKALNAEPSDRQIVDYARVVTCYLKVHLKNRMHKLTNMQQHAMGTCEAVANRDMTKLPDISRSTACTTFCVQELDTQQIHIVESCAMSAMGFTVNKDDHDDLPHIISITEADMMSMQHDEHETITATSQQDDEGRQSANENDSNNQEQTVQIVGANNATDESSVRGMVAEDYMEEGGDERIKDDCLPTVLYRPIASKISEMPKPIKGLCDALLKDVNGRPMSSTWYSKNLLISEYVQSIKFPAKTLLSGKLFRVPRCNKEFPSSMLTLDHLLGVRNRAKLKIAPENGLRDAFLSLWTDLTEEPLGGQKKEYSTRNDALSFGTIVSTVGNHLSHAMMQNSTSWVLLTVTSLYWRIVGNAVEAIGCLRQALHFAPHQMKDVPLLSLANVLHHAGFQNDAIIVTNMALELSPNVGILHFTMANIYAAKGEFTMAKSFYESALALQSTFGPAYERLRLILCGHGDLLMYPRRPCSDNSD